MLTPHSATSGRRALRSMHAECARTRPSPPQCVGRAIHALGAARAFVRGVPQSGSVSAPPRHGSKELYSQCAVGTRVCPLGPASRFTGVKRICPVRPATRYGGIGSRLAVTRARVRPATPGRERCGGNTTLPLAARARVCPSPPR